MKVTSSIPLLLKSLVIACGLTMFSCASKADLLYFQDESLGSFNQPVINPEIRYQPDDMLTINVSNLDQEVAMPFNLPVVSQTTDVTSAQGIITQQTYLVDKNGNIEFPVLGTIAIAGLTRLEATALIKNKLQEYLTAPIVNIRIANFTITVLGEVNNPGTFTIQDEKVSLTEALGLAGDLTIYGNRKNVLLTREVGGQKKFAVFDLTSAKVLASKNYYLAQNDFLYVEPNKARINSSKANPNNGVIISAVSTLATIVAIILTNSN